MGTLSFVGLGLSDEQGISLQGLEEARRADVVFVESYTSLMPNLSMERLERLVGKHVTALRRRDVEDDAQQAILSHVMEKRGVFLVPGDPMIATTHVDLRLRAERLGITTKVIGASSIQTAAGALIGLQSYKFGRTITIPFPSSAPLDSPYEHLKVNLQAGLHTLILLDLDSEARRYMTVGDGIRYLLGAEERHKEEVFLRKTFTIGIARAGADNMTIRAAPAHRLEKFDFGPPPHCIVVPAQLHFMEVEALKILARAEFPQDDAHS